jgi:putative addiction module component (TIGR02574 family)
MDFESVLTAVRSWPTEERLRLIEEVWDELSEEDHPTELTEDLKALLDRRLEALEKNPDAVVPWEVVEARALERFRK